MRDDEDPQNHPDLDDPHVAENFERFLNNLYRAVESDKIDIQREDIDQLGDAIGTFSEEEQKRFGKLSFELEREAFEGREGMEFAELSDAEREYFDLLEIGLQRARRGAGAEGDAGDGGG